MSEVKRSLASRLTIAVLAFGGLTLAWSMVLFLAWPWQTSNAWKAEFPLPAVCAQNEVCGIAYGQLAEAKAQGKVTSLLPPEDQGETPLENAWLRWKKAPAGQPWQIEAKVSSWNFQTTVHYRLENGQPVLVEYQEAGAQAFYYGMGAAALCLAAFFLLLLRGKR